MRGVCSVKKKVRLRAITRPCSHSPCVPVLPLLSTRDQILPRAPGYTDEHPLAKNLEMKIKIVAETKSLLVASKLCINFVWASSVLTEHDKSNSPRFWEPLRSKTGAHNTIAEVVVYSWAVPGTCGSAVWWEDGPSASIQAFHISLRVEQGNQLALTMAEVI